MASPLTVAQLLALPVTGTSNLREGDLYFCHGADLISKGIEEVTESIWSHCGVVWPVPDVGLLFLEAVSHYGVRLSPAALYLEPVDGKLHDGPVVFARCRGITPAMAFAMLAFGCQQLTDHYSTLEDARIAERLLFGVGRNKPTDGWICSELAAACLGAAGHWVPTQHGYVTPADLWADSAISLLWRGA